MVAGSDRAHRRYWVYETISGLFIEHDERFSGICIDKPVQPNPSLATAPPEAALSYIQKLFENEVGGKSLLTQIIIKKSFNLIYYYVYFIIRSRRGLRITGAKLLKSMF